MVLFVVCLLVIVVWRLTLVITKSDWDEMLSLSVLGIVASVVIGILLLTLVFSYPVSLNTIAWMENFQERNRAVFAALVEKYPNAVQVETKEALVKTTSFNYEFAQQVLKYNEKLKWYRKYQKHWFYGIFVARAPETLEFIPSRDISLEFIP